MQVKAVALVSSGLDSLLSVKIVRDLGIEVYALHCSFSFDFSPNRDRVTALKEMLSPFGIPLRIMDITESFIPILRNPAHGFGSAVNPCIDCHLFMLLQAKKWMEELGGQFVVTGEVVGQRPMSQNKPTLFHIEKQASLQRRILRPLSAKLLPVTIPEDEEWVDRERLYGISGRGRRPQEALASQLGIRHYFQPAGGCILTDPFYAKRIKAFIQYRGSEKLTSDVMCLCRYGRHFWIDNRIWLVVGRNENDNAALEPYRMNRWIIYPVDEKGPMVLADGIRNEEDLRLAAGITARYCKNPVPMLAVQGSEKKIFSVRPVSDSVLQEYRL